jgi:hypothetical protein
MISESTTKAIVYDFVMEIRQYLSSSSSSSSFLLPATKPFSDAAIYMMVFLIVDTVNLS